LLLSPNLFADADTLWHIRTGQWILHHAQVPTVDLYSYTAIGSRWISTEWLAEVFFAFAYNIGEWIGVVILTALACAAIIAIIFSYLVRNVRFSIAVGWTALTFVAISPHFLVRPHIFSYSIALIWLIKLLESYDRKDFRSSIPLFCVLMLLWANLHPSFTFGLVLFYVFVAHSCYEKFLARDYRGCKGELIAVIAVSVCALLTPYGIFSALLTLQTINMKYAIQHTLEWQSPNFQQFRVHLILLVVLLMSVAGLGVRLRGPRLTVYGILLILALSYLRGLTMLFLLTPILLAQPLSECATWFRAQHKYMRASEDTAVRSSDPILLYFMQRSIMIPAIFFALAALVTVASWRQIGLGPSNSVAPKAAVDFVRKAGITGNVFNDHYFGGYLIFRGIPTFIDGRVPPYTDKFLREYDNTVMLVDRKSAFQLLDRYKVQWLLLKPNDPLAKALTQSEQWHGVYSDKDSVVYVRSR
jgi:hypothetical protein